VWGFSALFGPFLAWVYAFQFFFPEAVRADKVQTWVKPFVIVLLFVIEFVIFKLFPRGTFAIGRGATRDQFLAALRWVVIVTLPFSILAGVIVNLTMRHF